MLSVLATRLRRQPTPEPLPDEDALPEEQPAASGKAPALALVEGDAGGDPVPRPFQVRVLEHGEPVFDEAFEAGTFVIGASPTADIIIPELGEPETASLRLEVVGAACLVTLTALAPGVSARGRNLTEGRPILFPEAARFAVDDAYVFEIDFTAPSAPLAIDRSSMPIALVAGGIALALLGLSLGTGPSAATRPDAPAAEIARPSQAAASPPIRASAPSPADPAARLASAADALRLAFVSANLVPQLRVTTGDGTLLVEGDVTPAERDRAMASIASFRSRVDVAVELALASDAREADFYTAVVLEPEAYLIGSDGRRYAVAQRLPNGALVVAIDDASVLLEHEGVRQRVFYGL